MADIDYEKLFRNGQLVWTEPHMLELLHRYYQSYKGYPEEKIFMEKYKPFLLAHHLEDLLPKAVPVPEAQILPEVPKSDEVPAGVAPPSNDLDMTHQMDTQVSPVDVPVEPELTDAPVIAETSPAPSVDDVGSSESPPPLTDA